MSDGIYLKGRVRPASKKAIREAILADASSVYIENTSPIFGGYDGPVSELPVGKRINFVGPDPYRKRVFYGSLERKGDKVVVK